MNTKNLKRVNELYRINPEVEEAINLVYDDVNYRLHNAINRLQAQQEDDTHVKSFLEGKRDAYWSIQDMLAKLKTI